MSANGFLGTIEPLARERVRAAMAVHNYERGNIVISQNDGTDDVYFVLVGRARAQLYSEDGKMVLYRDIEAGEIFGELAAIDATPRAASVTAEESLTVGRISGPAFLAMVEAEPALMFALLRYLSEQVRRMTARIFEFSTLLVKERLIRELLRMARIVADSSNSALISPAPTHAELAALISTHREAVSREMSDFAKQHLVSKGPDGLHILDIAQLERLLHNERVAS